MSIKIKLGELSDINEGLNEILEKELPAKTAYWLARISSKVTSEHKSFEKARLNMVKKHAKKDKKGNPLQKKDEKGNQLPFYDVADESKFIEEYKQLKDEECEIHVEPIKLKQLGEISIKPKILAKLEKIIIQ